MKLVVVVVGRAGTRLGLVVAGVAEVAFGLLKASDVASLNFYLGLLQFKSYDHKLAKMIKLVVLTYIDERRDVATVGLTQRGFFQDQDARPPARSYDPARLVLACSKKSHHYSHFLAGGS